jgi:glucosamine--fructose-6-phosphate aminotransferase (isomerizing)
MSMWNDILANPSNSQTVLQSQLNSDRFMITKAARLIHHAGRVCFTGIGSGMNATIPASYYLMAQGFPSQYLDTTEAAYHLFPGLKDSVLVLNTRSGETAEVVRLVEMARQHHIPTIAVTNEPGSRVGQLADVCIPTYSRWDDLVVVSAFNGMAVTELLLAGMVASKFDSMANEIMAAVHILPDFLNQIIALRKEMILTLRDAHPLYLLGRGPSLASAISGSLVIQETSRRDTFSFPTGLFRQGPIEVVGEKFHAVLFEGTGDTAILDRSLAQELLHQRAKIIWIGSSFLQGAVNITLPKFPAHILPLLEIIPTQVLAYDLAILDGIEPGHVQHIQKVITSEHGIMYSSSPDPK